MSFGEHLEEFRGALGRSLVGLVVGFLVALPFADNAVRLVARPLEQALRRLQVEQTTQRLHNDSADAFAPEDWQRLDHQGLVPQTAQLDLDSTLQQLIQSGIIDSAHTKSYRFRESQIPIESVKGIAKSVCRLKRTMGSAAGKTMWAELSKSQQQQFQRLSEVDKPTAADRSECVGLLNQLLDSPVLTTDAFDDLGDLFANDDLCAAVSQLRHDLPSEDIGQTSSHRDRYHRWLIAGMTGQPQLAPQSTTIKVTLWKPSDVRLQSLGAEEPFLILVKAAVILGFIISSPWVFFHMWNFVAAGLYPHEKNYVYTYLPFSLGLFFLGAAMAFSFVFQPVLDFLFGFNLLMNVTAAPRLNEWVSFVLFLPLGFGLSFQLPLVMLLLERIGVLSIGNYVENWRIAVLVIFVISMFLTPADPMSMFLMGVPLTALYFGGILLCRFMPGSTHHASTESVTADAVN